MSDFKRTADSFVPGSRTLERKYFVSQEVFELEKQNIFGRYWMCMGHVSELGVPGAYFVREVLDESLIVLLDKTGTVRAFYNGCRHLGTRICMKSSGKFGGTIRCDYHDWTYKLTGELHHAPHMDGVAGFRKEENGLISLPVHVWEGFIFVWTGYSAPEPFEVVYAEMLTKLVGWNVAHLVEIHREVVIANADWKLLELNFHECLHCPSIHPTLNKHLRYDGAENDIDEGACLGGFMNIKGGESMTMSGNMCAVPLGELNEKTRRRGWYYGMLVNLLINVHPDYLMFHMLFPLGPGKTRIVTVWLFNPASLNRHDFRPMEAVEIWDETNREDWQICERNQLGISSRFNQPGYYSQLQSLPAAWVRKYLDLMG